MSGPVFSPGDRVQIVGDPRPAFHGQTVTVLRLHRRRPGGSRSRSRRHWYWLDVRLGDRVGGWFAEDELKRIEAAS